MPLTYKGLFIGEEKMAKGLHVLKFGGESVTDHNGVNRRAISGYFYHVSKIPNVVVFTSGA